MNANRIGARKACLFTYFYSCKFIFKCVEVTHRAKKRLPPDYVPATSGRRAKRKRGKPPEPPTKKQRTENLKCVSQIPTTSGKTATQPCRICGFAIANKTKKVDLSCCSKKTHWKCWTNASTALTAAKTCTNIVHYLQKDRCTQRHDDGNTVKHRSCGEESSRCLDCGDIVANTDNFHTRYDCPGLNRYYMPTDGETYESATPVTKRSAAIVRSRIIASTPFIPRERDTSIRVQSDHPGSRSCASGYLDPVIDNSTP